MHCETQLMKLRCLAHLTAFIVVNDCRDETFVNERFKSLWMKLDSKPAGSRRGMSLLPRATILGATSKPLLMREPCSAKPCRNYVNLIRSGLVEARHGKNKSRPNRD